MMVVIIHNVVVMLIAMVTAAFVGSMYHVIAICFCHKQRTTNPPRHSAALSLDKSTTTTVVNLIPTHKYHKRSKFDVISDDEGGMCAVCLGDFEEGEELRTMPECLHTFHIPCIDMWLNSHSNCPICRASVAPSLTVNGQHYSIDTSHMAPPLDTVQSGFVQL